MTATNLPAGDSAPLSPNLPPVPQKTSLAKVAAASSIGTTIEWYDFFIYGTAAALVFPTLFFPGQDPAAATLSSFATFAVAFFARPVGAGVFGHFGDRIGRKRALVWTLMIMGVATVFIGLLPGYETGAFGAFENGIGIMAPILLVACRFFQGFAVGGEWAGATLLTAEYAPVGKRGMMGMWPQLGVAFAFFLSSGTFLLFSLIAGDGADVNSPFMQYGWRIPFLLSAVLVLVGLWIRISIEETPVFKQDQARTETGAVVKRTLPFADAVRHQWREILIAGGALTSLFSLFYMGTSFLTNYATKNLDHSRPFVLGMGMVAALVFGCAIAVSAMYSDRIGRKKVIGTSVALAMVWALFVFPILDTGSPIAFAVVLLVTLIIFGIAYGPAGALLPELFQARYRYTGAGLGYNLAGILGGALPPLAAAAMVAAGNTLGVGIMLSILSAMSMLCVVAMTESSKNVMHADAEITQDRALATEVP
ncbi:MFS transporter [Dietzia sp. ANT_WB102]|uniref:MFS transporter n=1 Tax=Dietzia sp. ANT_WB102 TaxID=2597345 RepID=UPI0011F03A36|nr:MFS transporter [Dietzia sp. ANT_WB102]KAA0919079.1 MHS family MFS transporter [Dietzia sp. ANT_WB102]